jgi:hypothetical protein
MSSGPFDDPHLDAAWRALIEQDRRLKPSPGLEARTLARLHADSSSRRDLHETRTAAGETNGVPSRRSRWLALAASAAAAAFFAWPRAEPRVVAPLDARVLGTAALAATVAPNRPQLAAPPRARYVAASIREPYVQHVELPGAVMQFDTAPLRAHEPLQMVRLRLPLEALQALGLALFELDASGVVDVDVVIGEDGLPRDIRQVRIGQEQR